MQRCSRCILLKRSSSGKRDRKYPALPSVPSSPEGQVLTTSRVRREPRLPRNLEKSYEVWPVPSGTLHPCTLELDRARDAMERFKVALVTQGLTVPRERMTQKKRGGGHSKVRLLHPPSPGVSAGAQSGVCRPLCPDKSKYPRAGCHSWIVLD